MIIPSTHRHHGDGDVGLESHRPRPVRGGRFGRSRVVGAVDEPSGPKVIFRPLLQERPRRVLGHDWLRYVVYTTVPQQRWSQSPFASVKL